MEIKKLKDHKSSQCHVVIEPNRIVFISYTTEVIRAVKVGNQWQLRCTGTYSATTRKQISWFLYEYFYGISYYDIKAIAGTDKYIIAM